MNSFVAPPFGKTLADFAGAAAMRAKISPEAAAVHGREEHQAFVSGRRVGENNASAGAGYGVGTREPGASVTSGRAPPKIPPLPPTPGETALMLRLMLATLFLSDGTPVVAAGDEYGHSLRASTMRRGRSSTTPTRSAGTPSVRASAAAKSRASWRRARRSGGAAPLFAAGGANVSWSDLGGRGRPPGRAQTRRRS